MRNRFNSVTASSHLPTRCTVVLIINDAVNCITFRYHINNSGFCTNSQHQIRHFVGPGYAIHINPLMWADSLLLLLLLLLLYSIIICLKMRLSVDGTKRLFLLFVHT